MLPEPTPDNRKNLLRPSPDAARLHGILLLGFSREITLVKIIFPAIRPGIVAGAMMAFGRALGETMAVMMVIGNSPIFPKLLGRGQTLPSLTALEMGSIELPVKYILILPVL